MIALANSGIKECKQALAAAINEIEELEAENKWLLTALDQITTTGDWQRTQEIAEEALEKSLRGGG